MIPLSVPNIEGNEWQYVKDCLDTGWVSSVGAYVNKFEKSICDFTGAKFAIATSNGTAALHIALQLAGVKSGDLVICPNITFVASANAIKYCGAEPLLVDVNADTWQLDTVLLNEYLSKNTKQVNGQCILSESDKKISCIMPVHILGNMCYMDDIQKIATKFNLPVVEDSTEALGSFQKEKHSGTFGLFGTLSFNGNKILTTGGGGMILTNDEELAQKAKHLTTQAKADTAEYYHDEVGYNYRLVNILAAVGVAQMELLSKFLEKKEQISAVYKRELKDIPGVIFQSITADTKPNNWLFTIQVNQKKELIEYLKVHQIEARPFWVPMNKLPMYNQCIYWSKDNKSENIYESCISIPCSSNLSLEDQLTVISTIKRFYEES